MSETRPQARYVLNDIEGTTSDIAFVKDILFPYAAEHLPRFIRAQADRIDVREQLDAVAQESGRALDDLEGLIEALLGWIKADQKITALKTLQGQVWRHGYQEGHFTGHLYADAHRVLTDWFGAGVGLGVYSSGSVEAQKLLFGYSDYGDLTPLFTDHFDTRVGHKREHSSYAAISQILIERRRVSDVTEILFLSDVVAELDAAKASGMLTCELRRDQAPASTKHPSVSSFAELETHFRVNVHA